MEGLFTRASPSQCLLTNLLACAGHLATAISDVEVMAPLAQSVQMMLQKVATLLLKYLIE